MRLPSDEYDSETVERHNAEPWQLALLDLNPECVTWGPGDGDSDKRRGSWNDPLSYGTWADFMSEFPDVPDMRNEIASFYFEVKRTAKPCLSCDCTGFSPRANALATAFFGPGGWRDKITLDEAQALVDEGRLTSIRLVAGERVWCKPAVVDEAFLESVNRANAPGVSFLHDFNHDAINRRILVEQRCKRLGIPSVCPACDGHGDAFTEPAAHVALVLWVIQPAKASSRFVTIARVLQADLPAVFSFLARAADRHKVHFAKVVARSHA
jgi:hypothetical protein